MPERRVLQRLTLTMATAASGVMVAALSIPAPAGAVTGGTPDGSQHPYVGALVPPGGSSPTCTVSLVRGDNGVVVALTDGHCLYRNGRHNGTGALVSFASTWSSSATTYTGPWYVHPNYDPSNHTHDLAAIVLKSPPPIGYAVLAANGVTANRPVGSTVTVVGIGQPYLGQRRSASEVITGRSSSWLYLEAGSGNSCNNDSGGPDLLPGTNTVLALTDQGTCSYDEDTRADTADAHWFVTTAATWPTLRPAMSLNLSSSTTQVNHNVTAYGSTSPLYSGETVFRQGYYSGAWHTWAKTTIGSRGHYSFTITPTVATTDYYRVYLPASATHPAGASRTRALTVTE
ncbi:MAG TPA: trypsin-like serine protease [Mycobacteriales bacterium]|nr:trypsin-like serine protease [Mycobacteriales bacterium]